MFTDYKRAPDDFDDVHTTRTQRDCADDAARGLQAYWARENPAADSATVLTFFLTDLRYWCAAHGLNFERYVQASQDLHNRESNSGSR